MLIDYQLTLQFCDDLFLTQINAKWGLWLYWSFACDDLPYNPILEK